MIQISIIIPVFNRGDLLNITLNSLVCSKFNSNDFEILIVDNCSTDSTKEVSEQFISLNSKFNIRYIFESMPGLLSGRQRGAVEAKGDILTFIDDDVIVSEYWLQAISDSFLDNNVSLVGGRNLPEFEITPPDWIQSFYVPSEYGGWSLFALSINDFGDKEQIISPLFVWGLNYSIRKKIFFKVGGFNPDTYPKKFQKYQGDGESGLSEKLIKNGIKAIYQPKALIKHLILADRLTIEFFERKYYYLGVCNSYSSIRKKYLNKETTSCVLIFKKVYRKIKSIINNKILIKNELNNILEIKRRLYIAYNDGYQFHKKAIEKDKDLINWITRANYWDYSIPNFTTDQIDESIKIKSY